MAPGVTTPPQITFLCCQSSLPHFSAPVSSCQHLRARPTSVDEPSDISVHLYQMSYTLHFVNAQDDMLEKPDHGASLGEACGGGQRRNLSNKAAYESYVKIGKNSNMDKK